LLKNSYDNNVFLSWDEMGTYDLPAMLNKALEVSGQQRLFYIGHSMGTTGFMVMANKRPGSTFFLFSF
jgi:lysosomal acid lipase/cholesteryl ester hydrolase